MPETSADPGATRKELISTIADCVLWYDREFDSSFTVAREILEAIEGAGWKLVPPQ